MSCALIWEAKNQVTQIAVLSHLQSRNIEQIAHVLYLLRGYRMLHYDNCIVNISSRHESVLEQELDLMEEYKCSAYAYFFRVNNRWVPLGVLNAKNP